MKRTSIGGCLLAAGVASALIAAAGSASAQLTNQYLSVALTNSTSSNYQFVGVGFGGPTAQPGWNVTNATTGGTFLAYCIDPLTWDPEKTGVGTSGAYSTTSLANFLDGSGATNAANPAFANQVSRTSGSYAGMGVGASTAQQSLMLADIQELYTWAYKSYVINGTADQKAAFGWALWEIVLQNGGTNGTSYSATTGNLRVSGPAGVTTQLNNLLGALNQTTTAGWASLGLTASNWIYTVWYDTTSNVYAQTLLSVAPQGVPEPATLALAAVALLGLGASRRVRR